VDIATLLSMGGVSQFGSNDVVILMLDWSTGSQTCNTVVQSVTGTFAN